MFKRMMILCGFVLVGALMFVDAAQGHEGGHSLGGEVVVEVVESGESGETGGVDLISVDAKLSKVLRELEELKRQRRWQEVVGGAGYLVGLTGVLFYVMGKKASAGRGLDGRG